MAAQELQELTTRVSAVETQSKKNAETLAAVKADTEEIIAFFKNAKLVGSLLIGFGKVAKWVTAIASAVAIIWALIYAYKHGTPPTNPL